MDIVIENFYNTINVNCDESFISDIVDDFNNEVYPDYNRAEIMKKAREKGITVKELSILTSEPEDEIIALLNA